MLFDVDGPAAFGRPTAAFHALDLLGEEIVDGQFLARLYHALAHVEDVAPHDAAIQIGIAAVVDNLGATAAEGAVDGPVIIKRKEVGDGALTAALGFAAADLLAGVLDDPAARRNALERIDSAAVNA